MTISHRFFLIASLSVIVSCSRIVPYPELGVPIPQRNFDAEQTVLRRAQEIQNLRTLVEIRGRADEESVRMRMILVAVGENKLRLEIVPQQAAYALAVLLAQDGVTTLYLAEDKSLQQAPSDGTLLEQLSLLPVSEHEILARISARLPIQTSQNIGDMLQYRLAGRDQYRNEEFTEYYEVDSESGLLLRFQKRSGKRNNVAYEFLYENFFEVDGVQLPKNVHLRIPQHSIELDLQLKFTRVNRSLDESLFSLPAQAH